MMEINTYIKSVHFTKQYGNLITIILWITVLCSHAFLLPKLLRDLKK